MEIPTKICPPIFGTRVEINPDCDENSAHASVLDVLYWTLFRHFFDILLGQLILFLFMNQKKNSQNIIYVPNNQNIIYVPNSQNIIYVPN